MDDRPRILLLDDGELDRVCDILDFVDVAYERLQGIQIGAAVASPTEMLVTSALRAVSLPFLSRPAGSPEPTWLVMHGVQEEAGLRSPLRNVGAHFVMRDDVDDESLRLLIAQILYTGQERRHAPRLPVDMSAQLRTSDGRQSEIRLVDWTRHAVRVEADASVERGDTPTLILPASLCDSPTALAVPTQVARSDANALVLCFENPDADTRAHLDTIFAQLEAAARVAALAPRPAPQPAADDAPAAGNDPSIPIDPGGAAAIPDWEAMARNSDRRREPRAAYDAAVLAFRPFNSFTPLDSEGGAEDDPDAGRTCIGHDLSPDGICIIGLPLLAIGTRLTLALHGGRRLEPIVVDAEVRRSDEHSTGLCFVEHDARLRARIARLVEGQAALESLVDGHVQPVVISRVLDDWTLEPS